MRPVMLSLPGEQPIPLRFDFNAICDVEERLGVPIAQLGERMKRVSTLRVLLWAGSRPRFKSVREAGSVLSMETLPRVAEAINEAFERAFPAAAQMDELKGEEDDEEGKVRVMGKPPDSTTKGS